MLLCVVLLVCLDLLYLRCEDYFMSLCGQHIARPLPDAGDYGKAVRLSPE